MYAPWERLFMYHKKDKIKLIDNELVDKQKGCKFWENKAMIEIVIVKRLEVKRAN